MIKNLALLLTLFALFSTDSAHADPIFGQSTTGPQKCASDVVSRELIALKTPVSLVVAGVSQVASSDKYTRESLKQMPSGKLTFNISGTLKKVINGKSTDVRFDGFAKVFHQNFYKDGIYQSTICRLATLQEDDAPISISSALLGPLLEKYNHYEE